MIEIKPVKEKNNKKVDPYYMLTYNYTIGDANGKTSEVVIISADNPYLERYVKLLNSLTPTKGHWGVMLNENRIKKHQEEGQITQDDYDFLMPLMIECYETETPEDELEDHALEFYDGVSSDTEHSFLVFNGIELIYIDEYGLTHETNIV